MSNHSRPHPLVNPRFWPMFWTQFAGAFNDNFFKNALGILVVFSVASGDPDSVVAFGLTSAQFVSASAAVFMLPYFLFSATAGQLADKYDKAHLMRVVKAFEILIMGVAAVGFYLNMYELLLVVLFMMGTQSAFFGPAKYGILPQLLEDEDLVGGNALVELATYLAILGGTIAGGLLITVKGEGGEPLGVYIVSVGVIAISVIGWLLSRQIVPCEAVEPDLKIKWDPIFPTIDILKITVGNWTVFLCVMAITWFWSFGTAFLSLFPVYAKTELGGGEGVATLFLTAFSAGIAVGSVLTEKLSRQRLELGLVPIGAFGMSLFCADLWFMGIPWTPDPEHLLTVSEYFAQPGGIHIFMDLVLVAMFGGMYIVPLYTMIQQRSDPGEISRVIAGNNIINALFMVGMSIALIVVQGQGYTSPQIFGMLAILNGVAALVVFNQVPEFLIRFVAWSLSNVFYRVKVIGEENFPDDVPCVVVCNHVSFVDWFILAGALRRPVRFVMDVSFAHLPVMRYFSKQEWVIPIASPKRDEVAYEQAFVTIRRKLREGWVVGIFPEGMLTGDGEMKPFRRGGIDKILERDPVLVVPVALNGLWGSWFSRKDGGAFKKAPRGFFNRVVVTIGKPIPADQASAEHLQSVVAEMWEKGAA